MLTIYLLSALLLLLILFIGIAGWISSEKLLRVTDSWYAVTLCVSKATSETITLPRRRETISAGTYGITWQHGNAIIGEIVANDEQTVTRRILKATQPPSACLLVTWNIFVYTGDPASTLGLTYEEIAVPSELGPLPAWFLPGQRSTWVLLVHGFHASREEALRVLPPLVQMGFPALVQSYRNDAGAPKSPDRFYHLGDTEWQDVEAGVRYALAHGAQDVVLYGWSMGGCIVETFLHRSSYATPVRAVILDAPILDWHGALDAQLQSLHFPHWFTHVMKWVVARRANIDFTALNSLRLARERTLPTLLFHGTADAMVPIVSSDTFAQARPDLITYLRVSSAAHTQAWNVDPQAYEEALKTFLTRVSESESPTTDQRAESGVANPQL